MPVLAKALAGIVVIFSMPFTVLSFEQYAKIPYAKDEQEDKSTSVNSVHSMKA
nr:hypothetical protein [Segatella copri]